MSVATISLELRILMESDEFATAFRKEASGGRPTVAETALLAKVAALKVDLATAEAAVPRSEAAVPAAVAGGSSGVKRKLPGEETGVPRSLYVKEKAPLVEKLNLTSYGRTYTNRDDSGKAIKDSVHAGHTAQAERLHEVAILAAEVSEIVPEVESAEAVELYADPVKMRQALKKTREALDNGISILRSQAQWVVLLNKHGYEKAVSIVGDDLGLPPEQAKRAKKLEQAVALGAAAKANPGGGRGKGRGKGGGRGGGRFTNQLFGGQPFVNMPQVPPQFFQQPLQFNQQGQHQFGRGRGGPRY